LLLFVIAFYVDGTSCEEDDDAVKEQPDVTANRTRTYTALMGIIIDMSLIFCFLSWFNSLSYFSITLFFIFTEPTLIRATIRYLILIVQWPE